MSLDYYQYSEINDYWVLSSDPQNFSGEKYELQYWNGISEYHIKLVWNNCDIRTMVLVYSSRPFYALAIIWRHQIIA